MMCLIISLLENRPVKAKAKIQTASFGTDTLQGTICALLSKFLGG